VKRSKLEWAFPFREKYHQINETPRPLKYTIFQFFHFSQNGKAHISLERVNVVVSKFQTSLIIPNQFRIVELDYFF
jgi:hypothetical protein